MGLSVFLITCLLIFDNLWKVIAIRIGQEGLNGSLLLWYIASNEWILVSVPQLHEEIEDEVKNGQFTYMLPRPISYLGACFSRGLGKLFANLIVLGIVTFGFAYWKTGVFPLHPLPFFLFLLIGFAVGALALLALILIGLSSFWIGQVAPLYSVWEKLYLTLGGLMIPLTIYPDWLQNVANATLFPILLGERSALLLDFSYHKWLCVSVKLGIWMAGICLLITMLYALGLKKIQHEGG